MKKTLVATIVLAGSLLPGLGFGASAVNFIYDRSIYADAQNKGLSRPEGVACHEGVLVAADTGNGRLLRFRLADGTLGGGEEIKVSQLKHPLRVHINSKGEIFALDGQSHALVRLSPEGEFRGTIDAKKIAQGENAVIRSFALDRSDQLYLLDIYRGRVLILDPSGSYLREIPFPKEYGFFSDLTVDARGTIHLLDSVRGEIVSAGKEDTGFTPFSTNLGDFINFATVITTDPRGSDLFVIDQNGGGIILVGQDGSFRGRRLSLGWKEGLLYYPGQICFIGSDAAVVADRGNSRLQMFRVAR